MLAASVAESSAAVSILSSFHLVGRSNMMFSRIFSLRRDSPVVCLLARECFARSSLSKILYIFHPAGSAAIGLDGEASGLSHPCVFMDTVFV